MEGWLQKSRKKIEIYMYTSCYEVCKYRSPTKPRGPPTPSSTTPCPMSVYVYDLFCNNYILFIYLSTYPILVLFQLSDISQEELVSAASS